MLEDNILKQIKEVFNKLESNIYLEVMQTSHSKQKDLIELLESVSSTSEKIKVIFTKEESKYPRFEIKVNNNYSGIKFSGIPGGHEFSSLILSILYSDLKGKMPDKNIIDRIKNLKGPVSLQTYISLSCENCPEVVQNLNLIAALNKDFSHEMIDGEFLQEKIKKLNIQGVPSIVESDRLIHSGKISLIALIEKLENNFGKRAKSSASHNVINTDVVVIGGGPAGVSSAIYTSRKGLHTTLISDRIGGQVQDTKGIENMISINYTEGKDLSNSLNKHMSDYEINILEHRKVKKIRNDELKFLELDSGEKISSKAIIIATGAEWKELGIEGEKEYNGRGVAFCPHCDGPYYKGKDICVIGGGNSGVEAAIDLAGIVKSVKIIEYSPKLNADGVLIEKMNKLNNIDIITNARTNKIIGDGKKVTALEYEDRESKELKVLNLEGIFVQIGLVPNSNFLNNLVKTNKYGEILVDDKNRTNIDRVYAAGDVTNVPYKQIIIAMGEGAKVGLSVFEDLMIS